MGVLSTWARAGVLPRWLAEGTHDWHMHFAAVVRAEELNTSSCGCEVIPIKLTHPLEK